MVAVLLAAVAFPLARLSGLGRARRRWARSPDWAYGAVAVAARILPSPTIPGYLADPATYALLIAGAVALLDLLRPPCSGER